MNWSLLYPLGALMALGWIVQDSRYWIVGRFGFVQFSRLQEEIAECSAMCEQVDPGESLSVSNLTRLHRLFGDLRDLKIQCPNSTLDRIACIDFLSEMQRLAKKRQLRRARKSAPDRAKPSG